MSKNVHDNNGEDASARMDMHEEAQFDYPLVPSIHQVRTKSQCRELT